MAKPNLTLNRIVSIFLILILIYANFDIFGFINKNTSNSKDLNTNNPIYLTKHLKTYHIDNTKYTWFKIPYGAMLETNFENKSDVYMVSLNGKEKKWTYHKFPFRYLNSTRIGFKTIKGKGILYLKLHKK